MNPIGKRAVDEQNDSLVLGIDLGGTKILSAVINPQGDLLSRDHSVTPAAEGEEAVLQAIVESARRALDEAKLDLADLTAIGIGAPGPSNPKTGILYSSPNLPGLRNVPIRNIIGHAFDKKAFLINDANAAALAEFHFGTGRGARCFLYVTVSTGIGGGVIIDGKVFTGAAGTAAEIGHMTIEDEGPLCTCGNTGCWEALASGTALAKEAQRRIREGAHTSLLDYCEGEVGHVTAKVVQEAGEAGDGLAKELIARTSHYLGTGFANLINLFNPDLITVGGGLANMGPMLLEPAYAIAKERAFRSACEAVRYVPARLDINNGVLGAAAYALQQVRAAE
jgi:glucokinase